jgi:hypothetical protein
MLHIFSTAFLTRVEIVDDVVLASGSLPTSPGGKLRVGLRVANRYEANEEFKKAETSSVASVTTNGEETS